MSHDLVQSPVLATTFRAERQRKLVSSPVRPYLMCCLWPSQALVGRPRRRFHCARRAFAVLPTLHAFTSTTPSRLNPHRHVKLSAV
jgi:hypothetical protein